MKKKYSFKECDFLSTIKGSLITHIQSVHESKKTFLCDTYNYRSPQKVNIRSNKQRVHRHVIAVAVISIQKRKH